MTNDSTAGGVDAGLSDMDPTHSIDWLQYGMGGAALLASWAFIWKLLELVSTKFESIQTRSDTTTEKLVEKHSESLERLTKSHSEERKEWKQEFVSQSQHVNQMCLDLLDKVKSNHEGKG